MKLKKHDLYLDVAGKAIQPGKRVFICKNCPTSVEAGGFDEAREILSWPCAQNMVSPYVKNSPTAHTQPCHCDECLDKAIKEEVTPTNKQSVEEKCESDVYHCVLCHGSHLKEWTFGCTTILDIECSTCDALPVERDSLETRLIGKEEKANKTIKDHICRFNDGEQSCDCYAEGYTDGKAFVGDQKRIAYLNGCRETQKKVAKEILEEIGEDEDQVFDENEQEYGTSDAKLDGRNELRQQLRTAITQRYLGGENE